MSTTESNTWADVDELKKEAEAERPAAMEALGEMLLIGDQVEKDVPKGMQLLEKAAKAGRPNAAFRLGKVYEDGEIIPRDANKALEYYRQAALAGVSEAQYNLGAMYVSARGVRRDYKQGLAWLIVATKSGAGGEGETQVRDRLTKTNRGKVIPEAEALAAELERQINEAKAKAQNTK